MLDLRLTMQAWNCFDTLMIKLVCTFSVLLLAGHLHVEAVESANIQQQIPAKAPSRAAHFNWLFESESGSPVQIGQFACGSYWVAPANGEKAVVLKSLTGKWKDDLLSCDIDPRTERHGLLSGKNKYGSYEASENILTQLPLTLTAQKGSCLSLVAAMQRNEERTSKGGTRQIVGEVVDAYCVVTVLSAVPANKGIDMIRPNIMGTKKEFLTWDDFDLERIKQYDFLSGKSDEEWLGVARRWRHSIEAFGLSVEYMSTRHGLQFRKFSEGGRAFRSHLLVHNYASGTARAFNSDIMALLSAQTDLQKNEASRQALAAMLAYGLDLYHARYNYGEGPRRAWTSGAGQSLGTLMPPVLAAALLKDEQKAHQLRQMAVTNHHKDAGLRGPQELRQIKRGVTGVLLWGDGNPIVRKGNTMVQADWRYWADFSGSKCYDAYPGKGNPNRGKKTACDPYGYIDGPANKPGSSYMSVSIGGFRATASIMILLPHVRSVVNTDAPIEYVDRLHRHGLWTWPDPVAAPAAVDQETARLWWSAEGVKEWGVTWGVRQDDVRFAIEDGKGRFKSLHAKPVKGGYEVSQALKNWEHIMTMYNGLRFEDNAVGLEEVVAPEIVFATGEKPAAYLFCADPRASIYYTTDGAEPTPQSKQYQGKAIAVTANTILKAMCIRDKKQHSKVRQAQLPLALNQLK